jgi:hypothetical protein
VAQLDFTAKVAPELAPSLEPGEAVRLVTPFDLTPGADRSTPAPRPAPPDDRGAVRRGAEGTADFLASLATNTSPVSGRGPDVDRLLNGVAITGAGGSIAQATAALLDGPRRTYLAVTDRRILAVSESAGYRVGGSLDRAQVVRVEHRPVLVNRGRVVVTFTDGSTLALQTRPQLTSRRAKEFVRTVTGRV